VVECQGGAVDIIDDAFLYAVQGFFFLKTQYLYTAIRTFTPGDSPDGGGAEFQRYDDVVLCFHI
ncbi:MAG: hypothetical protein K2G61_02360, partial [Bacteroidaceae bacterium]|nr:hypothetical protein [Bacteroidaceae bacterium]